MTFTENTAEMPDMRGAKAAEHIAKEGVIADIPAADIAALTGTPAKTLANIVTQVDLVTTEVAKLTAIISGGKIPVNASGVTLTADLIDLDVEAITGAGAAAKTLADVVTAILAGLTYPTLRTADWATHRTYAATSHTQYDTQPVGVDTLAHVIANYCDNESPPAAAITGLKTQLLLRLVRASAGGAITAGTGYLVLWDSAGVGTIKSFDYPASNARTGDGDAGDYISVPDPVLVDGATSAVVIVPGFQIASIHYKNQ